MSSSRRKPRLLRLYHRYLDDQQVASFMLDVADHYAYATLERMAGSNDPELRRAAVLALGLLGTHRQCAAIGRALNDPDRAVRLVADQSLRDLRGRGRNDDQRRQIAIIRRRFENCEFLAALNLASDFVFSDRGLAEAWHLRAEIRFALHSFRHAARDAARALRLDRYHDSAAVILGRSQLALGQESLALRSFHRALRINPDLEQIRLHVRRLQQD
ncbi:MAG: HEAT repeat domain-containing protein [Planctomycetales bacterium]|nr:HEAT repeat domain-containing protein [Planctomycetales bacterium]